MTNTPLTLNPAAKTWLESNRGWAKGLPAEVSGITVKITSELQAPKKGHKHEEHSFPSQACTWWTDGYDTTVGAPAPLGQILMGLNPEVRTVDNNGDLDTTPSTKDRAGWRQASQYMMNAAGQFPTHKVIDYSSLDVATKQGMTSAWPTWSDVRGDLPLPAMKHVEVTTVSPYWASKEDTLQLKEITWLLVNAKNRSLFPVKGIHTSRKYQIKVQQLEKQLKAALDENARAIRKFGLVNNQTVMDHVAVDHSFLNAQAMVELVEVLSEKLTAKEMECLEQRAFGVAVSDTRRLLKAQLKAQKVLRAL